MVTTRRPSLIRVLRKTTYTDGENVRVVVQDSHQPNIPTDLSRSSKKIIESSKKITGNWKPGKELWKNVPTAIRYAPSLNVKSFTRSDPEVDLKLDEMCKKAFVTGELDNRAYTLEEIGNYCGISRERVRQVQDEALNNMRALLKDHMGWELSLKDLLRPEKDTEW